MSVIGSLIDHKKSIEISNHMCTANFRQSKPFFFGQKDLDCQIYTSQIDLITFMMDSRSPKGNIMVQGKPISACPN